MTLESRMIRKLSSPVWREAVGKGPAQLAPRWRPTLPHVRFGERAGETERQKRRHRAPVRLHWATDALDQVRRDVWNNSRGGKARATARSKGIKNLRWVLWRNPEDLSEAQTAKLAWVERTHPGLHRAWALKEGLRWVYTLTRQGFPRLAITALDRWLSWARRSQLPAFVDLARRIRKHRTRIEASLEHRLSNALLESVNTKLRLLTRQAFGFHNPHALIGLAMLALGGLCPPLPGR